MELARGVQAFVDETVLPNVGTWDRDDVLPDEVFDAIVALGLPGALVPASFGGPGVSMVDMVGVWRALSRGWISLTGAINPTGLATALLVRHGTDAQRARWLPGIAAGDVWASFSITEPQAGSDLARLETSARIVDDGLELDGSKRWVAGGVSSQVVFMLVQVDDQPTCVILPTDTRESDGWTVGELDKVGYRGVESATYTFRSHVIPGAEVLGGLADGVGAGARFMLDALDVGRVNVACRALGIADRALACAIDEAVTREVGDGLLADHTHAQLRIGELRAQLLAAAALTEQAAAAIDARDPSARELSTAAKLCASDLAVWAVDRASRLAASRSYAAHNELARLRRDAPQTQIGEGANDALLLALAKPLLRARG